MFSLPVLEHQLVMYVTDDSKETFATPFDLSKVPVVTREQADAEDRTKKLTSATPTLKAPSAGPKPVSRAGAEAAQTAAAAAQQYAAELQKIPEIAAYGGVLKSSAPVELTESETEYVVSCIKHIFAAHIVLQFSIKNTLPDTVLADVSVVSSPSEDEEGNAVLEEDFIIPADKLMTDIPGTVYAAFKKTDPEGNKYVAASFTNVLKFTSKEIDPTTNEPEEGGYEDEYQVEDLELGGSDYVLPAYAGSFDNVWEQAAAGEECDEASETLQLGGVKSISGMSCPSRHLTFSLFFPLPCLPNFPHQYVLFPETDCSPQKRQTPFPRRSPCSRWKGPTWRSTRRRTRSSCTARRLAAARWRRWCAWPTAPRRA